MYAKTSLFAAFAVAALGLSGAVAQAAEVHYKATLTGADTMPDPVKTSAVGELQLVVSADGKSLRYVLTVKDLLNPSAGDLHLGPAGANGPLPTVICFVTVGPNHATPSRTICQSVV